MGLVLDTGGMLAFERGDREIAALVEASRRRRDQVVTSSGCVAEVWRHRGSGRELLALLLRGVDERSIDHAVSRSVGALCAATATNDVVDAHVALLARDSDVVVTTDTDDLQVLLRATGWRS